MISPVTVEIRPNPMNPINGHHAELQGTEPPETGNQDRHQAALDATAEFHIPPETY
jgi:hypothetical protein